MKPRANAVDRLCVAPLFGQRARARRVVTQCADNVAARWTRRFERRVGKAGA